MSSLLSTSLRSTPLQERAARRVAHFLEVAAELFGEMGYEGTTMTAVAERAGASIGALYRWFPDKEALAVALRTQYANELRDSWAGLIRRASALTVEEFAAAIIDQMVDFCRERPAYLVLHASPIKITRDPAARKNLRDEFSNAFRAYDPKITPERALLVANVAIQMVKGLVVLYIDAGEADREALTNEFKRVMALYLSEALSGK